MELIYENLIEGFLLLLNNVMKKDDCWLQSIWGFMCSFMKKQAVLISEGIHKKSDLWHSLIES